ncbi:NAD(P)/FAD-dependent oxidoreductase [Roseococcus sp. YIM B11640]|uniref:NAD(P)/FAD-dependent oxidoreductase n=1 Tax=Roseococcus sp. YIM B11640 TaxID=3133973 RepID=UPI003C7E89AA
MQATPDLDLHTGQPIWNARSRTDPPHRPLLESGKADVVVIGCGVSGALVADALVEAGREVLALDRRGPAVGSTSASTALLQFEIDQPLTELIGRLGRARAVRAWWRSATAVEHVHARISDLRIPCSFRSRQAIYLPGNVLDLAGLRKEAETRARVGLRSHLIDGEELRRLTGIERDGAILSAGAAEVDPRALALGLWRAAVRRGARLHAPCDVVDIDPGPRRVLLTTSEGFTIEAKYVALATGYELSPLARQRGYKITSTWAYATAPQPDKLWPSRCLIWEAASPYLYIRTTTDGRVMVGGEDEGFKDEDHRDRLLPRKVEVLRRKLAALIPGIEAAPDYAWTGCFGESPDGLPLIGPIAGAERCFRVLGFGGNGLTFSAIAAQLIQRAILGLPDPDAELFSAPR